MPFWDIPLQRSLCYNTPSISHNSVVMRRAASQQLPCSCWARGLSTAFNDIPYDSLSLHEGPRQLVVPSGIFIDASIDILLPSFPLPSLYFLSVFVTVLCRTHPRSACFPSRPVKLCSASSFAREILGNGVRVRGSISDLLQRAVIDRRSSLSRPVGTTEAFGGCSVPSSSHSAGLDWHLLGLGSTPAIEQRGLTIICSDIEFSLTSLVTLPPRSLL